MASSLCGSCRLRLRPSHYTPFSAQLLLSGTPHRAPFHSSAAQHAAPAKKSSRGQPGQQLKFREPMASRMKPRPKPTKPPRMTPQERRAMKQPVSISNANALVVPDAKPLSLEDMADESMHGKMLALPPTLLDRLRALGAFAESSDWRMFKIPTTLVRRETLELGRLFGAIAGGPEGTDRRRVARIVSGARGTGKSVHLLQAMTMGLLSDWVVINVPNARDLTCATTAYSPLSNTAPVQYIQKNATADLLRSIANANANALSQLHVSQSHATLDQALRPDSTLHELANFGATRPEYSWLVFQALWKELTATAPDPSFAGAKGFQRRPPMVITVDNLSHWMTNSLYFSAEYKPIHAHDLTLVRHFLSILSSPSALPSGGLALYATSTNNRPLTPALDVCIKQVSARNAGVQPTSAQFPLPDPYAKLDARVMAYFNEIHAKSPDLVVAQELRGVSKEETRGLLEFYARSGILRQRISEEVVAEKWTLAGGGILGELNKFGKRMHALN